MFVAVGVPALGLLVYRGAAGRANEAAAASRPKTSSPPRRRGLDLGLAILKKIVEQLDGTIGVTSEVGRGTTFTMLRKRRRTEGTGSHRETKKQRRAERSNDVEHQAPPFILCLSAALCVPVISVRLRSPFPQNRSSSNWTEPSASRAWWAAARRSRCSSRSPRRAQGTGSHRETKKQRRAERSKDVDHQATPFVLCFSAALCDPVISVRLRSPFPQKQKRRPLGRGAPLVRTKGG